MTTAAYLAIGFFVGAVLFGWTTIRGLTTGKMLALGGFAEREKESDWYWGWAIINGATAALSAVGFLLMMVLGALVHR